MEYHSNSKSSSRNSNEVCNHNLSTAAEISAAKNNLEDIFEDDCTNSSVGDLSARSSHGNSWSSWRESNASQQSASLAFHFPCTDREWVILAGRCRP